DVVANAGLEDVDVDGEFAAVLAAFEQSGAREGAVYILRRNGTGWSKDVKVFQPDEDSFRHRIRSIALSGDRLAVGSDHTEHRTGVVFVFRHVGSAWLEESAVEPVQADNTYAGEEVALEGDGM